MEGWRADQLLPTETLPFLLTALLIELTPGPNMTYLALVSASEGRRAGFATVAGITLGLAAVGLIAAFGVTELIQSSATLYELLRWAGVVFLLYLAWEGWHTGTDVVSAPSRAAERYFVRGLITNLLNPKAGLFYISVLPTFIDQGRSIAGQAVALTTMYVAVATTVHVAIVLLAGRLEPFLNDPRRELIARRLFSGLLAMIAIWFAWSTRR
jgi:threonine/homoserine/homoserine lactone efflux protein